ncbi:MAG: hypothetical protein DI556_01480 [Rhodovulum sulfidophilum]|uniref:Zinc finger/thioredoxin putative domain-containing protein n=1 Tax=Rhodovulum sulfidophilum TaxID=35806 RepID=A0A2W5NFR4_RHOSU|nr:MAG: hypothetical protein DI556_01480 [Rhodovulum sulfidophilum]
MRLTCPNCGAEYDVPEGLIPPAGKHVQCSACHTRWFRRGEAREELSEDEILRKLETRGARPGPRAVPSGGAEGAIPFPVRAAPEPEADPEPAAPSEVVVAPEPEPEPEPETPPAAPGPAPYRLVPDRGAANPAAERPEAREAAPVIAPPPPAKPAATATPAAPSAASRAAAETRSAPGLAPARSEAPADSRGAAGEPGEPRGAAPRTAPRIELADPAEAPPRAPRRRGRFLPGFILALLVVGLAFEVYIWRAPLAEQIPAAAPVIEGYADGVDAAREWLGTRFGRPPAEPAG